MLLENNVCPFCKTTCEWLNEYVLYCDRCGLYFCTDCGNVCTSNEDSTWHNKHCCMKVK